MAFKTKFLEFLGLPTAAGQNNSLPAWLNKAKELFQEMFTAEGDYNLEHFPEQEIQAGTVVKNINGAMGNDLPAIYAIIAAYNSANGITPGGGGSVPANQLPVANAGADTSIMLPTASVTLAGTASDADGTVASTVWSKFSGPATFTITNPNQLTTTVTNLVEGAYVFRLTVTDDKGGVKTDDRAVNVLAPVVVGGVNPITFTAQEDNPGFPTTEKVSGENKYTTPVSEGTDNTFNNNAFMGSPDYVEAGEEGALYVSGDSLWAKFGGSTVAIPKYHTSPEVKFNFYGNYDDMNGSQARIYNENGRQGALTVDVAADYRYNKTNVTGGACRWALQKFVSGSWTEVYVCAYNVDERVYGWGALQKRGGVAGSYLNNPRIEKRGVPAA